jgi:amino acid transporter
MYAETHPFSRLSTDQKQVNYVTGEFINPARDLPRTIHTSLFLVILSYLLANVAYTFVLPQDIIISSNTIAVKFGSQVFGPIGSLLLALAVSGSCFGALNATTFTSGRLVYAAAKEGYLPSLFGHLGLGKSHAAVRLGRHREGLASTTSLNSNPRSTVRTLASLIADEDSGLFFTPINAMLLNAALTALYICFGQFDTLLTFYGVAGYTFYFMTVLGLIILRVREPELERPYRVWITTPIIFCCVSLFLLSRAIFSRPLQALLVACFVVAGLPVYWWRVGRKGNRRLPGGGKIGPDDEDQPWWKFWKRWGS